MDIDKYRHDFEIIRLTADQLTKDFGMHGLEITFSGNELTAWDELMEQAEPLLMELYRKNTSAFQALLYRIDISDRQMKELFASNQGEFGHKLAEAVIRREFQKVLLRKYFSSGGTSDK